MMPRMKRLCIPGYPMHIVQRGNNRPPCFHRDQDYVMYLNSLAEMSTKYEVDVHAFVLMTNHVHILVTPTTSDGASRMMQQVGRKYVQPFNKYNQRSGTLWEGRFHSTLIDSETYLFTCYRYIELNPVRAHMVNIPDDYRRSSYRVNALGSKSTLIKPRQELLLLSKDRDLRLERYRRIFSSGGTEDNFDAIRFGTNKGLPVGSVQFREKIEATLDVSLGSGIPGRPRTVR
jgi:putative transposase